MQVISARHLRGQTGERAGYYRSPTNKECRYKPCAKQLRRLSVFQIVIDKYRRHTKATKQEISSASIA